MQVEAKIKELGYTLLPVVKPAANYVSYRLVGDMLYLSGHGPRGADGTTPKGKLGRDLTTEQGYEHARQVGLNLLASAKEALGDLDRVEFVVKLLGMVNAAPDFTEHPKVINGCSDLLAEVFGKEQGVHARSAVGFSSLPGSMSVEIEAIMKVKA